MTNAEVKAIVQETVAASGAQQGTFDRVWEHIKAIGLTSLHHLSATALEHLVRRLLNQPVYVSNYASYGGDSSYGDVTNSDGY